LLAESWNGRRWTVQATVEPTNAHRSAFGGVSCLAKQGCIAFGVFSTRSNKPGLLAEQHS
jgi:hypothetical protein